jgi:hypothetical protein
MFFHLSVYSIVGFGGCANEGNGGRMYDNVDLPASLTYRDGFPVCSIISTVFWGTFPNWDASFFIVFASSLGLLFTL